MTTSQENIIITVSNVFKTYHLGEVKVPALRGVSLHVQRGDFLIITGRNGSGKSTLLRQLGLLDVPDAGEILFEGVSVMHLSETQRRERRLRHLGYIFQEYALIPELTALENVSIPAMMLGPLHDSKKRAMELLQKVGMAHRAHHLPKQLSGGEQQKIAIARALINHPKIIFADEPTANLDTIAAQGVLDIFTKLNVDDGLTIMMITHEEEERHVANRIITLVDGRII